MGWIRDLRITGLMLASAILAVSASSADAMHGAIRVAAGQTQQGPLNGRISFGRP
jgi:hypothetical protein